VWLKLHLAIALVVGLDLALVGLTGSLLVFYKSIDAWLNPALLTTKGRGPRTPIDDIFAAVRAAFPEAAGPDASSSVQMPSNPDSTYQARVKTAGVTADDARWQQVSLDPHTGMVLGVREADAYLAGSSSC
jgi:uncharacterized iron-regulated membrane protein